MALLAALATAYVAWWTVPIVGAARGMLPGARRGAGLESAAGGALAWTGLLLWSALHGPTLTVAAKVGPVFGLPPWAFVSVTVLFATLLAGAAGTAAARLRSG